MFNVNSSAHDLIYVAITIMIVITIVIENIFL